MEVSVFYLNLFVMIKSFFINPLWIIIILFCSCAGNNVIITKNRKCNFAGIETTTKVFNLHGKVKSVESLTHFTENLSVVDRHYKYGSIEPIYYYSPRYREFDSLGMQILSFAFLPVDDSIKDIKQANRYYYHEPDIIEKTTI